MAIAPVFAVVPQKIQQRSAGAGGSLSTSIIAATMPSTDAPTFRLDEFEDALELIVLPA